MIGLYRKELRSLLPMFALSIFLVSGDVIARPLMERLDEDTFSDVAGLTAGEGSFLGFIISNTLNAEVSSAQRATVLSFKGLIFNLGYGFASLMFALALRAMRDGGNADQAFSGAIEVLPLWMLFTLLLLALMFRRQRTVLQAQPAGLPIDRG